MPRPTKCRRVCHFPKVLEFLPVQPEAQRAPVRLTVDEYETIRLIDREGLSQEACGEWMQVARTTVQKIYDSARKKLAEALVEGVPLHIEGGEIQLCDGKGTGRECIGCFKRQYHQQYKKQKGDAVMRIAVTYENGQIFQHFGRTEQFKVYDVQDGNIVSSEVVGTGGSGHGALAGVLTALKVDTLICGGIGAGAQTALAEAGVCLYGGVSGSADEAVDKLLAGNLAFDPDVHCDHHEHGHHGEGHRHGNGHGCGEVKHGCAGNRGGCQ